MLENDYSESLFRAVDTIIAERIKHLPYDYTQLMEITDDKNANAGIYKVSSDGQFEETVYSDNSTYEKGDKVYVLNTAENDARRFIIGLFLKNSTGRTDRNISTLYNLNKSFNLELDNLREDLSNSFSSQIGDLNSKYSSILQLANMIQHKVESVEDQIGSSILQTADMIRTDVWDELNGLHSSIQQTAGMIRSEVEDNINRTRSRITQTADEIKSEVEDDINGLYSVIDQTAGEIRSEVSDYYRGLHSMIDQTAGEILMEVTDSLDGYRARFDITAYEISSRVEDAEGNFSTIQQTADEISSRVQGLEGNYSQISQTADMIRSRVQGLEGNFSEIKQTADEISSKVQDLEGNYSQIVQTAYKIQSEVHDANGNYSQLQQTVNGWVFESNGETVTIDGSKIAAGTLKITDPNPSNGLEDNAGGGLTWGLGDYTDYSASEKKTVVTLGMLLYGSADEESAKAIEDYQTAIANASTDNEKAKIKDITESLNTSILLTNAGIRIATKKDVPLAQIGLWSGQIELKSKNAITMYRESASAKERYGEIQIGDGVAVIANTVGDKGGQIGLTANSKITLTAPQEILLNAPTIKQNASTIHTSDQSRKHSISAFSEAQEQFFNYLEPKQFKYNDGTSDRYHYGFIANQVKTALDKAQLSTQDFAGYCEVTEHDDEGKVAGTYLGLRYAEFISLNTYMIQKTRKELEEKDKIIDSLESRIDSLERKLDILLTELSNI